MSVTVPTVPATGLLTRDQAAAYLGVAAQTLAAWASSGRYGLPYYRAGRCVRYKLSDLDTWLANREQNAAS